MEKPDIYVHNPPEGCNGAVAEMLIEWENQRRYEASLRLGSSVVADTTVEA